MSLFLSLESHFYLQFFNDLFFQKILLPLQDFKKNLIPLFSFSWPIIIANPLTNKAEVAFKIEIFLLCFLLVGGGGRWGGLFCHLNLWKVGLEMYMLPVEGESSSLVLFIDKILLVTLIKVFFSPHKVDFILQDKNSMTKSIVILITILS